MLIGIALRRLEAVLLIARTWDSRARVEMSWQQSQFFLVQSNYNSASVPCKAELAVAPAK